MSQRPSTLVQEVVKACNRFTDQQFRLAINGPSVIPDLRPMMEEWLDPDRLSLLPWPVEHLPWVNIRQRLQLAVGRDDVAAVGQLLVVMGATIERLDGLTKVTGIEWNPDLEYTVVTLLVELLRVAIKQGKLATEQFLIECLMECHTYHLREVIQRLVSPLTEEVAEGRLDAVRLLLGNRALMNALTAPPCFFNLRPIVEAALANGHLELVELLMAWRGRWSYGWSSSRGIPRDESLVEAAIDGINLEMFWLLLEGVDSPAEIVRWSMKMAARRGQLETVQALLLSPQVDSQCLNQAAALAAREGHSTIIELLLTNARIPDPDQAVVLAAQQGHWDILRRLLPDVRGTSLNRIITEVAENGHLQIVRQLLLDPRIDDIEEAAIVAIDNGHIEVAQLLVKDQRITVLNQIVSRVVRQGYLEWMRSLLLDPRVTNHYGIMRELVIVGDVDTVQMVIASSQEALSRTSVGNMAELASGAGHLNVVDYLLTSYPNYSALIYTNALVGAMEYRHDKAVEQLLLSSETAGLDIVFLFQQAINTGNCKVIRWLLTLTPFPEWKLAVDDNIRQVSHYPSLEAIELLLAEYVAEKEIFDSRPSAILQLGRRLIDGLQHLCPSCQSQMY